MMIALILFFMTTAKATETVITEHRCVTASSKKIHAFFTDYDHYSTLPGATYRLLGMSAIRMVKSQCRWLTQTEQNDEALVWIVFQPLNLTDSSLYPRLLMNCKTNWLNASSFTQDCHLQKDKQHYGLNDLSIAIHTQEEDGECAANQSGVQIEIHLDSNSEEVQRIKTEALKPAGVLSSVIKKLFHEDSFFKGYYQSVYHQWVKALNE